MKALLLTTSMTAIVLISAAQNARAQAVADPPPAAPPSPFEVPATDEGLPGEGPIRRGDWFKPIWRDRRASFHSHVVDDRGAVVFLGDSITQGWGDDFRGAFKPLKVANRGISGDTTRGMLVRLAEDVIELEPKAVVMLMGANDLDEQKTPPEVIARNIERIVDELKEHNAKMPVVLCLVMPSAANLNRSADEVRETNRLIVEAMQDQPQVTVLDTWTLFANDKGDAKLEEFPDLLHPNDRGYAKWAAALRPVFATLGFLEAERDDFVVEEGFVSLFNGRDLTGWGYRPTSEQDLKDIDGWKKADPNMPPWPIVKAAESFDGLTASPDGRYVVKNGRLVVLTPSEGRKIQKIWTQREFPDDFTLRLEFRATPNADSGIYIRGPQLQCRDYLLAGPYASLTKYKPQDWNLVEVTVTGGKARATCNGEVLEAAMDVPTTGPIGLEGDRGQMEYRRIRVKINR